MQSGATRITLPREATAMVQSRVRRGQEKAGFLHGGRISDLLQERAFDTIEQ